jgi:hypothetical protein
LQILHADGASVEALLCHYQYAKRRLEESLADEHKVQSLLDAGVFQVNYLDGFSQCEAAVLQDDERPEDLRDIASTSPKPRPRVVEFVSKKIGERCR